MKVPEPTKKVGEDSFILQLTPKLAIIHSFLLTRSKKQNTKDLFRGLPLRQT